MPNSSMRTRLFVGLLAFGAGAPVAFANAETALVVHHFKERRALTVDRSLVAVLSGAGRHAAADLAAVGVDPARVRPWAISGWSLVEQVGAADDGVIARAVGELSAAPGIEFVTPVFIGDDGGPMFPTADLLVGFDPSLGRDAVSALVAQLGAGVVSEWDFGGMPGAVRIASGARSGYEALSAAAALAVRPEVLWAEPDMIFTGRPALIPDDTFFGECWPLLNTGQSGGFPGFDMGATEAWDITLGDPSVVVVVLDTGVQQDHPDLHQRSGADLTSQGPSTGGPLVVWDNHGTPVAGCISAIANNGLGVAGVAPGVRVASARTFISVGADGSWTSFATWTVNALAFAESIGARVTNNSNAYGFTSSTIVAKYNQTRDGGMVHFAAAGNDAAGSLSYPASVSAVNAVASVNRFGALSSFSNTGPGLDFSAPGSSVVSIDRTGEAGYIPGDYVVISGTSFASPYAAGVAALALSVAPSLTAAEVEEALRVGSVDLGVPGYDTTYGHGMVHAHHTVTALTPQICVGDVDLDGFVGFVDLNFVVSSFNIAFGEPGFNSAADLDDDFFVGFADLNYVLSAFNSACP